MVAIFTGAGTGFERGSGSVLGSSGLLGSATLGRGGEQVFLNAATGNLMISNQDEFLTGTGLDASVVRTYNSLGDLSDNNGDNWRYSAERRIYGLTGTANTAGSTVRRVSADGSDIIYSWDSGRSAYVTTDGSGAYDTLTYNGSTWVWGDGDTRNYEIYSAYGTGNWRITTKGDTDLNKLTFTYTGSQLTKVTTQDGSFVQYDYDASGNVSDILTSYTDLSTSTGKTLTRARYSYDSQNRLQTVTVDLSPEDNSIADGKVYTTTYTYSGTSTRVASISQSDGSYIAITYDASNRVSIIDQTAATGVARRSTLTYGAGYTTVTDPLGQTVRLDYDASNNLTKITLPPASTGASPQVTQFAYNANGDVTSVTDALGNAVAYTYDAYGNALTTTDRLGNVTTRTYGLNNNVVLTETTTSSDAGSAAASHTVRFAYDSENHLRYRVEADGSVTEYRYTAEGDLQYVVAYPEQFYDVSALGSSTSISLASLDSWQAGLPDKSSIEINYYVYDARHNLASEWAYSLATTAGAATTGDGYVSTYYTYDQAGRLLSRHINNRASETFVYDGMGRLTSAVDVNGGTTSYVFDDANSKTVVTFASGLVRTSTYDKAGELISVAEAGAATSLAAVTGTATYAYDQDGRLRWQTDATGNRSYYIYDNVGRKIADVDAAGEMTEYSYDADDRLIASVTYANWLSSAQLTALNDNNAVIDIASYRPAANASDTWNWRVYDKEGRLVQAIDGTGTTTINVYDGAGRLVQSTDYSNNVATSVVENWKSTRTAPSAITNPYPLADAGNCVTRNFYDSDGRFVGTLDAEGYLTQIVYDRAGQKTDEIAYATATNSANRASGTFNQLLSGLANAATDRHTRYVYDGQGQLRFVVDSTLHVVETQFDNSGDGTVTIAYSNALASTTTDFTYDNVKALVAATGFASAADRKTWSVNDAAGRLGYSINAEGGVTRYTYNSSGQVTKTTRFATVRATTSLPAVSTMDSWATTNGTNAANRVTRYFYDGAGVLRYTVDAEGYVTRRTEDAEGRLTTTERFANASAFDDTATINSVHSWVVASAGTSAVTTNAYDPAGRLLSVTDPVGSVRRYAYYANGTLQSETAAYGTADASTTYYYRDSKGRVTDEWHAFGTSAASVVKYAYDVLGNVRTITDSYNRVTTQTFDHLGRVLTRTDPLNGVTTYQYNGFGEVVCTTDALGRNSYSYYDLLGRVRRTADALKYVTDTTYDSFGGILSVKRYYNAATNTPSVTVEPTVTTNAKDATTSFTYDNLGRLKSTTDAEGYSESYTLNAFGNRVSVTNKLGGVITNTFDRRGLLLSETLPMASVNSAGTTVASTVTNTFTYDSRGNRISMTEASGLAERRITTYAYDKADRLIQKTGDAVTTLAYNDFTSTTSVTLTATTGVVPTETYAYDLRGNLIQYIDANGAKTFSYYDALDRKIAEVNPLGTLSSFTYDALGNKLSDRVYGDFVALPSTPGGTPPNPVNGSNYRQTNYYYDELSRLQSTGVDNVLVGAWDSTNNGVSRSTTTVSSWNYYDANGNVIRTSDANGYNAYSWYDALGRKTDQLDQEGYLTHWTYDAEGNVLSERRYATKFTGTPNPGGSPPTVANDATNDRVTNFTYDKTGHRLTETRTGVAIGTVNTSNGALTTSTVSSTVTYTYNGLGQVTTKQEGTGDTVTYAYDNSGRLTKENRAAYLDQTGVSVTPAVTYSYDGLNNLTRTQQGGATLNNATDPITTYTYRAGGRLASMTNPDGGVHNYEYDAAGNRVRDWYVRTLSNNTTSTEGILYRRDLLGRVVTQAIAKGVSSTSMTRGDSQNTQYDAYGEVSQRGVNGLWQESFTYNNRGLVEKTNSGDGVWRFYVYDRRGNAILEIASAGNDYSSTSLSTVLSALGTYAGSTFVSGVVTNVNFVDGRGQTTLTYQQQRELAAGGARVTIGAWTSYNAFGEVASQTDSYGYVTSYSYNTMGRLTAKALPTVNYTKADKSVASAAPTYYYYYDKSGRTVASKDPNGNVTSRLLLAGSGYGGTDTLVTSEFHPDGGVAKTFYDVFGDARILRNELGQDESRTYDKMGRLITQVHRGSLLTDNYTYDLLGQRITHWNSQLGSTVKETTDYDLQGRVVSQVALGGDAVTTSYVWSATLATSGMGTFGGWTQTDTYANSKTMVTATDIFGRDVSKTDLGGHAFTYSYDKAGRQVSRSTTGETLTTTWLNSGLVSKLSLGASDYTNYTYDKNGNNLTEYTVRGGVIAQNATATYDSLNRMISWSEAGGSISPASSKTIEYDLNSNIRRDRALMNNLDSFGAAIGQSTEDQYYTYDSMNRQVAATGGTSPLDISTSYYDVAGQRVRIDRSGTATMQVDNPFWNEVDPNTRYKTVSYTVQKREDYTYNSDGTLQQVQYAESTATDNGAGGVNVTDPTGPGAIISKYTYDAMQRMTLQTDYLDYATNNVGYQHSYTYNTKGQVTNETVTTKHAYGGSYDTYVDYTTNSYGTGTAYALGSVIQIDTQGYKNGSDSATPDPKTVNTYAWYDGAVASQIKYWADINTTDPSMTSTYVLSPSGVVNSVSIADGRPRTVTFTNDLNGQVIRRDEADALSSGDPHSVWYLFNGRQVATTANQADPTRLSYKDSIADRTKALPGSTYSFTPDGRPDGDLIFEAVNSYTQGSAGGRYVAQGGETLQMVAAQTWGDSSLWYKIAEANGLGANSTLVEGQTLTLPAGIVRSHSNASTFKPYDASEAIGNTAPTTPKPKKGNKCGVFGQVLLVAIAVAVTVVTSGAAIAALGPAGTSLGTGIATVLGTSGGLAAGAVSTGTLVAAGAIGGAVGSIASQGFGVATGIQQGFSWKGVALSALAAGIGAGLGPNGAFGKAGAFGKIGSPIAAAGMRAVTASALTQGIGVITGLQNKFDWAGVAAAGVGAAAATAAATTTGFSTLGGFNQRFLTSMASDITNAAARSVINGSDFGDNLIAALPDIIGETVGQSLAFGISDIGSQAAVSAAPPPANQASGTAATKAPQAGTDLHITTTQGDLVIHANGGDLGAVKALVERLPADIQAYLASNGVSFAAVLHNMVEFDPNLAGVPAPGWNGLTYDVVPGGFYQPKNVVVISTETLAAHGSVDFVFHEIGHAIDYSMQGAAGSAGKIGSDQPKFVEAYNKIASSLITGNPPSEHFNYYSEVTNPGHGRSETFAESFAAYERSLLPKGSTGAAWDSNFPTNLGASILVGRNELTDYWKSFTFTIAPPPKGK